MANDADWVADVRRWYFSSQEPMQSQSEECDAHELGYEAAHPVLQSRHWPDAPRGSQLTDLK